MSQPDDNDLERAIQACDKAADAMGGSRPFRLRVLLDMIRRELEKERLARVAGQTNGHTKLPSEEL